MHCRLNWAENGVVTTVTQAVVTTVTAVLLVTTVHLFQTNYGQSAWNSVKVQPISTVCTPIFDSLHTESCPSGRRNTEPPKLTALFPNCMHRRLNWPEKGVYPILMQYHYCHPSGDTVSARGLLLFGWYTSPVQSPTVTSLAELGGRGRLRRLLPR